MLASGEICCHVTAANAESCGQNGGKIPLPCRWECSVLHQTAGSVLLLGLFPHIWEGPPAEGGCSAVILDNLNGEAHAGCFGGKLDSSNREACSALASVRESQAPADVV